jgi:hypothetical protein
VPSQQPNDQLHKQTNNNNNNTNNKGAEKNLKYKDLTIEI